MPHKVRQTFYVDENGRIQPRSRAEWLSGQLKRFADGRVQITVERPKRSLKQNNYYWGVVIETVRKALLEAGQPLSAKALHEHFKHKYLGVKGSAEYVDEATGEMYEIVEPPSTTDLDTTEMHDYIEHIRNDELVLALGCYVPAPGEDPHLIAA